MRNADEIEFDEVKRGLFELMRQPSPSGIAAIDEWGHMLRAGEVTLLFAASQMPRTALALELVWRIVSERASGALVFTPGCSAEKYLQTLVAVRAGVNRWRMSRRLVPRSEMEKIGKRCDEVKAQLRGSALFIEDDWCIDPDKMVRTARLAARSIKLGLIVVDRLQDCSCGSLQESAVGWGVLGSRLKRIAEECRVPVLVLSGVSTKEVKIPDVLAGYGCLHEYIGRIVAMRAVKSKENIVFRLEEMTDALADQVRIKFGSGDFSLICAERCAAQRAEQAPEPE